MGIVQKVQAFLDNSNYTSHHWHKQTKKGVRARKLFIILPDDVLLLVMLN